MQVTFIKHLQGQHNQQNHAHGSGNFRDMDVVSDEEFRTGVDFRGRPLKKQMDYFEINREGYTAEHNFEGYSGQFKTSDKAYSDKERAAIYHYTSVGGTEMNKALRNDSLSGEYLEKSKDLDSAFEGSYLKKDTNLYRAVSGDLAKQIVSGKEGLTIQDKGYTSTTISQDILPGTSFWDANSSVMIKIQARAGSKALAVRQWSKYMDEHEVLLPRNGTLKFTGKTEEWEEYIGGGYQKRTMYVFDYIEG